MGQQIDLFYNNDLIQVADGWFLKLRKESTAQNQQLIFDVPGAKAMHHTGQKSYWLIDGIAGEVYYSNGDCSRKPSKNVVQIAIDKLKEATDSGLLFPATWNGLLEDYAYSNGYDSGFDSNPSRCNKYKEGSREERLWNEGFNDAQEELIGTQY